MNRYLYKCKSMPEMVMILNSLSLKYTVNTGDYPRDEFDFKKYSVISFDVEAGCEINAMSTGVEESDRMRYLPLPEFLSLVEINLNRKVFEGSILKFNFIH